LFDLNRCERGYSTTGRAANHFLKKAPKTMTFRVHRLCLWRGLLVTSHPAVLPYNNLFCEANGLAQANLQAGEQDLYDSD
jgi:hypothetical protein